MIQTLLQADAVARWLHASVTGVLRADSRAVVPGDAFVAWPGAATDGRRFVRDALAAGAVAALVEREGAEAFGFDDPRVLAMPDLKAQAGAVAAAFVGHPSDSLDMVAFTGTNGKTSSAWWMAQLLSACQRPAAVVGTLGIGQPGRDLQATGLTTPDPVTLQTALRRFVDTGVRACAVEASSIGLVEGRLNGTRIGVAVFTNFTQDHLDFHGSMDAYWAAKRRLFDWPGLQAAVINTDDPQGPALAEAMRARALDVWTVAIDAPARLSAHALTATPAGMAFAIEERDAFDRVVAREALSLPLVGRYNVHNLLGVIAAARALDVPLSQALAACGSLGPVPGRLQAVPGGEDQPLVLVDYAHTPDAVAQALAAVAPLAARRGGAVWVVLGCGGDRDPVKRPRMAAAAEAGAARVVLTSDNPRREDPAAILDQMRVGLQRPQAAALIIDRAEAIAHAVAQAAPADVVLIAGKGHEDYQDIGGTKRPFSDAQQAAAALARRAGGTA